MIDISDGLSTDLHHLCEEGGVGAELLAESLPLAKIGRPARKVDLRFALHGGEAYELLFTVPGRTRVPERIAGVPISQIGQITRGKRVLLSIGGKSTAIRPEGWEHFAASSQKALSR